MGVTSAPSQHPMGVTPAVHPTGRLCVPSIRWLWGQCWLYCCPLPTSWGSSEGREGGDGRMDGRRDGHGCRSVAVTVGGRRGEHWGCAAALRTPPTQPPYGSVVYKVSSNPTIMGFYSSVIFKDPSNPTTVNLYSSVISKDPSNPTILLFYGL